MIFHGCILAKNIYQCAILFECCIFQYSCSESFESFLNVSFFMLMICLKVVVGFECSESFESW